MNPLGIETLDGPTVLGPPIDKPIMQSLGTTLPKLDPFRLH
jgi:hypothetical protein